MTQKKHNQPKQFCAPWQDGGVIIELDVRDASTNTQLYAIVYAENEKPWQFLDYFSRFRHAKSAMKIFAKELTTKLHHQNCHHENVM